MKRVRRITTIQDWSDTLYFIFYNFFYTDLIMHKQGVFYEKEMYQKKTTARLEFLFSKLNKIIKKSKMEELIEVLKKPEEEYLQRLKEAEEKWLGKQKPLRVYIPEKVTKSMIFIEHMVICQEILEKIKNNEIEKKEWDNLLKLNMDVVKDMHRSLRKGLLDYGYVIKKEKRVKIMKK